MLYEGQDPRTPLLERVKFLAIVSSNLDEFFMKRIGGLKQQVGAGVPELNVDGRTPEQQIVERQRRGPESASCAGTLPGEELWGCWRRRGYPHRALTGSGAGQRAESVNYYVHNIFPAVHTAGLDPAHPFPFISNLSLNLLVTLRYPGDAKSTTGPSEGSGRASDIAPLILAVVQEPHMYVPLEDVMANNWICCSRRCWWSPATFRVTRNAIAESDEEQAR